MASTVRVGIRSAALYLVVVVLLVSIPAGVGLSAGGSGSSPAPGGTPAAVAAATDVPAISPSTVPSPPHSPHPGTLDVYEVAAGGATTVDPAVAYDTTSSEPILNVYETLISYNGSSASSYVPTLATCVPGTVQCSHDYGSNLTGDPNSNGVPTAWTFVIDPAAHFYDPSTGSSWPVFPSDVVFSIARTLAFADLPYAGKSPGWVLAQALLPNGSTSWDGGIHAPYNNTPQGVLASMLVNDSSYCPASAMNGVTGNGCATFIADGSGTSWPFFLELLADGLGGSIVPCGWFTAQSAGIPGWSGTLAGHGDGSCLLPDGGNTTNASAWTAYLGGLSPTAWDAFELLERSPGWPTPQPNVQWNMVGSGPYASEVFPGTGYTLARSPAYQQPSGCSGAHGLAIYGGGCDPAPSAIEPTVDVFWEPNDIFGLEQYGLGQADFAGITNLTEIVNLQREGKLNVFSFPTLTEFFAPIDLDINEASYVTNFPGAPVQTISPTAFTDLGLRNFFADSYPYATVENTLDTHDGLRQNIDAGGPIPMALGSFYPTNITFPYELNGGVPDPNSSDVGGAAWWWAEITNASSPLYDAQIAGCTPATPCTFALPDLAGAPTVAATATDWAREISGLTGGAIAPFVGPQLPTFCPFNGCLSGNTSTFVTSLDDGWSPDFTDPSDYTAPLLAHNGAYTKPDSVGAALAAPATDNVTVCGHAAVTFSDLLYWAHAAQPANLSGGGLNESCQGVAYGVLDGYLPLVAGGTGSPAARALIYNLIEQISNALALNVFQGQSEALETAAPWINGSTIDTNPMIGGGGDQLWFQIRYIPTESAVTFKETGLPSGATWQVTSGSPGQTQNQTQFNVTTPTGGSMMVFAPNGTLRYVFTAPSGYGAVHVTGSGKPTFSLLNVSYKPAGYTLTVRFGPLEPVNITELESPSWPGLPPGTAWSVTLSPTGPGGATGETNQTTGDAVGFRLPAGASFKFQVAKPSIYKAAGGHGSFTVPDHALTKSVKFAEFTSSVTFTAVGLPAHTGWTVVIQGAVNLTLSGTTAALTFHGINGTYNYTIAAVGAHTPMPSNGTVTVTAPRAVHVRVVFTDPPGPGQPAWALSAGPPVASAPVVRPTTPSRPGE